MAQLQFEMQNEGALEMVAHIAFPAVVTSLALAPHLTDNAPSWATLREQIYETPTGQRLQMEAAERTAGRGPPHTDALLRLFDGKDKSQVRVTIFRDSAAWCPYCQKTWLFLEEKRIPYSVQKIPLNAYGDKPAWYTRKVDGGKLPAIELDGIVYVESFYIMKLLDATFDTDPKMFPSDDTTDASIVDELLNLEKELQRDWFSLVFYPVEGEALETARNNLLGTLEKVDQALGQTSGPWFLGGDRPSMIDIQYIVQMERLIASALYWKGLVIRGKNNNIDRWLEAFEKRPTYIATKSDYYTHAFAMPSQNGPGYSIPEAKDIAKEIYGLDGAWKLPLKQTRIEPLAPLQNMNGEEGACHEAAFKLVSNADKIVQFCCRGAGEPGKPSFHAELADPYSEPNYDFQEAVDVCLRHVTSALLHGADKATSSAVKDLAGKGGDNQLRPDWYEYTDLDGKVYYWNEITGENTYSPPTQQLDSCLMYLRDRVGVPRDMGQAAALQLRAHLNWAIEILSTV